MPQHARTSNTFDVQVQTRYLPEQSDPAQRVYRFAYTITITNEGNQSAQLIARHWVIIDGSNQTEQVRGLGVVGQQPLLEPGESFEYTSSCQLQTASGTMQGHYLCVTDEGDVFECPIETFELIATDMPAGISTRMSSSRLLH
ncbi:Co2+/Mg2+ efflux protein ApaG [Corticibacter populi]|uniref:Protein ApaG n=1 Tax=Corticibacter populi TaxID=1550736 RepID=A0A3M6QPG3_9BURK|nr:Co2+/Mg2+ efflux protein ApaG [Corticibacter populi]RMX04954.1 Co2+/Mg2+ efflux protein ApaG [Corticibacter populi]RZS33619.1 ApaG protein [Corticibacter populi]